MGNAASCSPSRVSNHSAVKVVTFGKPVTAAELTLENPGHFVYDSGHLNLQSNGHIYYLLPIELLYSVLTTEELSCLNDQASRALKHGILKLSRIFPPLGDFHLVRNYGHKNHLKNQAIRDEESSNDTLLIQRSWRPALETIVKTPHRS
ncbi:hypothetical protein Leryth_024590 [Lithospermum erythrorhizon]|nr:hypothetical protein Leryth_024590 [Lithospermum erythrorhizon]